MTGIEPSPGKGNGRKCGKSLRSCGGGGAGADTPPASAACFALKCSSALAPALPRVLISNELSELCESGELTAGDAVAGCLAAAAAAAYSSRPNMSSSSFVRGG